MNPNIVSPQQNIPPQPPIINQPTPSITPQKKSHFLLWLVIIIIAIILGGAGYYFLSQKPADNTIVAGNTTTVSKTGDIPPINDSDLRIPVDVAVVDCSIVNSLAATTSDELTKYVISTSTAKASVAVQSLIKKYSKQINTYVNGGDWTKTATVADINDRLCSLNGIRTAGNLALANAKFLAENKKTAEAEKIITGVLNTTQQIQNNAGSLIGYLVTIAVKGNTINLLLSLKSRGLINTSAYRTVVLQYADNKVGMKKAWQMEYSRDAQKTDDIASDNVNSPLMTNDETVTEIIKNKTNYNFEPNNTKLLLYNFFKSEIAIADSSCIPSYKVVVPAFDENNTSVENYLGKKVFSTVANSINSMNKNGCDLETKFNQF